MSALAWVVERPFIWIQLWFALMLFLAGLWARKWLLKLLAGPVTFVVTWGLTVWPFIGAIKAYTDPNLSPAWQQVVAAEWIVLWLAYLLLVNYVFPRLARKLP